MPHQCTTCGHAFDDGSKEMLGGCPSCGGTTFQFYPAGTEVPEEPPGDPDSPDPPDSGTSSVTNAVGRASSTVRDLVSRGDPDPDPDATWPGGRGDDPSVSSGEGDIIDADSHVVTGTGAEDGAQASARGDLVDEEEISRHDESRMGAHESGPRPNSRGSGPDGPGSGPDGPGSGPDGPGSNRGEPAVEATGEGTSGTGVGDRQADLPDSAEDGRVVSEPGDEEAELSDLRAQLNDQFESIKIVEPGQYELNLMELYDREEYVIALQENGRYVIQVPEDWLGDRVDD